jgi:hypothetical protein
MKVPQIPRMWMCMVGGYARAKFFRRAYAANVMKRFDKRSKTVVCRAELTR